MQSIGDYLKKLLYHYDCIVVPTLGAFLTHAVSASFHEATGQFMPPRRKVAFNEALTLDDGILVNYVMLHESIARDEALRRITTFVATLKQQARQLGSFSIDGLGLFSYNTENSLQFDPELRHNFLGNTYGMQPVMLASKVVHLARPVGLVKPLPVVPVRQVAAVAPVTTTALALAGDESEESVLSLPVRRTGAGWRWAAAALLVGSLGFISYFSVIRPGDPLQSSLNPASLLRLPTTLSAESVDKAATSAKPTESAPVKPSEKAVAAPGLASPVVTPANKPALVTPVVRPVTPAPAHVPEAVAVVQPRLKTSFTVIAGSFASRLNAVRFRKRLVRAGYSDAYILPGRGLIKVAAIGTASLSEAEAGIDSLNSLTGVAPWIMRN